MLENEVVDANSVESSNTQSDPEIGTEREQNTPAQAKPAQEAAPAPAPEAKPFHEHERFKELIAEKNELRKQLQEIQRQNENFAKFQREAQQAKSKPPVLERLKGIDPEFATEFERLYATQDQLQELAQWKQTMERDRIRETVDRTINELHTKNSVPEEWREDYQLRLNLLMQQNPNARLSDLPSLYDNVHNYYKGRIEGMRRQDRAAYVDSKKADAAKPATQSKGQPVSTKQGEGPKTRAELKAQLVRDIRAQKEAL